jgi:hypothetical protein
MKAITLKLLIILLLSFIHTEFQYIEKIESSLKRLQWNKDHVHTITRGRVDFEYSKEKGTHCIAKANLTKKQFVFDVPKEYLICLRN